MQESPGSNRETIGTYFLILSGFEPDMQSHRQHIKDRHKKKQVCNNIISTTHRGQTHPWNWIKAFLLIQYLYMGILHQFSVLLFLLSMLMLLIPNEYNNTKEGAYIPFSLSKEKLSNLDLINLSTCIKSNKCLSYLRTRAYLLKVHYNVQVCSVMNAFIQMAAHQLSKVFQKCMCWRYPAVFLSPRAGSLDE